MTDITKVDIDPEVNYKLTLGTSEPEDRRFIMEIVAERLNSLYGNEMVSYTVADHIANDANTLLDLFCMIKSWKPLPQLIIAIENGLITIDWADSEAVHVAQALAN